MDEANGPNPEAETSIEAMLADWLEYSTEGELMPAGRSSDPKEEERDHGKR